MLKLKENELLENSKIRKVKFEDETYFCIDDLELYINENLSDVEAILLPFSGEQKKAATITTIEKGRKQEELSEFNKALLKGKYFKK